MDRKWHRQISKWICNKKINKLLLKYGINKWMNYQLNILQYSRLY